MSKKKTQKTEAKNVDVETPDMIPEKQDEETPKIPEQKELPGMPKFPAIATEARLYLRVLETIKEAKEGLEKATKAVCAAMHKAGLTVFVYEDVENTRKFEIRKLAEKLVVRKAPISKKPRNRRTKTEGGTE